MFRFFGVLSLLVFSAFSQSSIPQADIDNAIAHAESLYFEARFKDSLDAIAPLDEVLKQEPLRVKDRIRVKLQMALAHVGLNDIAQAKARFAEVCALDPSYSLDREQFAGKVLSLFDEAKAEHSASRCTVVCEEVDRLLTQEDAEAILRLMDSDDAACPCLKAATLDAAELFFQKGLAADKENNFAEALNNLRIALRLQPGHELATQYVELTQTKLRLAADRLVLDWRVDFGARQFPQAAAKYQDLVAMNIEDVATAALGQIQSEYRSMLSSMAESWKRACGISEVLAAETRRQALQLVPDASIGADILSQMEICPIRTCLNTTAQLAMVRLRSRVNPELPRGLLTSRLTVQVKVRIDEMGNVSVTGMEGGNNAVNPAVEAAVARWKFNPAIVAGEPTCVVTELPIILLP
jgi:tetratricopeptide (TPR) repeat protein